jgi:hypothetical protein
MIHMITINIGKTLGGIKIFIFFGYYQYKIYNTKLNNTPIVTVNDFKNRSY